MPESLRRDAADAETRQAPWFDAPVLTVSWNGTSYDARGPATMQVGTPVDGGATDRPRGVQGSWRWDGTRLDVRSDRYGHVPLFWTTRPGWVAVSPSLPALVHAGAATELDYDALAVFLRLGVFIQEDTPFTHIRALPPSGTLSWDRDGVQISGGLTLAAPIAISRTDALHEYVRLMRTSVSRRLPATGTRPVLPLSGGADSRHILLELLAAGVDRPWCPTARMPPPRRDHDALAAHAMADDLDIDHEVIDTFPSRFAAEVGKHWRTSFCSITLTWSMSLIGRFGADDVVYDGLGGDVLSAGVDQTAEWYQASQDGRWRHLAEQMVRPNESLLRALLTKDAYAKMPREPAVDRIADELARHAAAANPVGSFMFFNENRRNLSLRPMALFASTAGTVHTPYLDDDLVGFLASLPAPMTARSMDGLDFHTDAIRLGHPDRPDWPYAYTATDLRRGTTNPLPPANDPAHFRRFSVEAFGHVARHRSRLVARGPLLPRLARQAARRSQHLVRDLFTVYLIELERLAGGATGPRTTFQARSRIGADR